MKSSSGTKRRINDQKQEGSASARLIDFFSNDPVFDSVMNIRLIAAGVLFLGGIIAKSTWPAVSVCLWLAVIIIAGFDLPIRFVFSVAGRHAVTETLSVLFAVIFAIGAGYFCEAAAIVLLYRVLQLIKYLFSAKIPDTGNSAPTERTITVFSLVSFTSSLIIGIGLGLSVRANIHQFLHLLAIAQIYISPFNLLFSASLADMMARKTLSSAGLVFHSPGIMKKCAAVRSAVIEKAGILDTDELCVIESSSRRLGDKVMLRIAAHACAYSDTEYAKAVMAAYTDTVYIDLVQSFQEDNAGITVTVDGVPIIFGLASYLTEAGVNIDDNNTDTPAMFLAISGEYAGRILFGDKPAEGAEHLAAALEQIHAEPILFTDGTLEASKVFANEIGIKHFFASPISRTALLHDLSTEQIKGRLLYAFTGNRDISGLAAGDISMFFGKEDDLYDITVNGTQTAKHSTVILNLLKTARGYKTALIVNMVITALAAIIMLLSAVLGYISLWQALWGFVSEVLLSAAASAVSILKQVK